MRASHTHPSPSQQDGTTLLYPSRCFCIVQKPQPDRAGCKFAPEHYNQLFAWCCAPPCSLDTFGFLEAPGCCQPLSEASPSALQNYQIFPSSKAEKLAEFSLCHRALSSLLVKDFASQPHKKITMQIPSKARRKKLCKRKYFRQELNSKCFLVSVGSNDPQQGHNSICM